MAGFAKTNKFMFSAASVLIGAQAGLLSLNTAAHSIGLVKNVTVTAEPRLVDLTQGVLNDLVDQQTVGMDVKVGFDLYEYTPRNLAYGLNLNGIAAGFDTATGTKVALQAPVAAAATTFTLTGNVTSQFPAGAWGFLQEGTDDYVHVYKVASSAFSTNTTVTITGYPVPAGMSFSVANGTAGVFNKIDLDPTAATSFFSARIVGTSKNDTRPVILTFPKVRITKGFNMRFATDNFGSMPFEFMPFTPIPTDSGYNADWAQRMHITL